MKAIFFLICKKIKDFKPQKVSDYSCFETTHQAPLKAYLPNKQFIRFATIILDILV
jgi:hypothetical protein